MGVGLECYRAVIASGVSPDRLIVGGDSAGGGLTLAMLLAALDQTIVGPALPTIVTQLSGNDYYVWAITIYLLTSTITVSRSSRFSTP